MSEDLGISGRIARLFQDNALTPLLALLGLFAIGMTPREEEPQIDVTFANVFIPFPGATAEEVEHLVSLPAEQVLAELEGLKHVYSVSSPGMATLTVEFEVGEPYTDAVVRLYNKIYSHQDWLPANLGVGRPLIKPKGIDDVPILALTLWSRDATGGAHDLSAVAHALEAELKRIPGTRDVYSVGDTQDTVRVLLDPARLAGYGIALEDLRRVLIGANTVGDNVARRSVRGSRDPRRRRARQAHPPHRLAAMLGALFILDDPIFNGLAIALIFGILVSTLLTLLVIPVLFYSVSQKKYQNFLRRLG